jgi:glycosyltransferase involved in cell wall biosynthesis
MFSVVIPIFNKRHTLPQTVRSVLAQTFGAFELILVDDGSSDASLEAVAGIEDGRVRRLGQANRGPGPARNTGIGAARNEWVALLDADDLWAPDHLAELDRIRRRHPRAGLIGTASVLAPLDRAAAALLALGGARRGRIAAIDLIAAFGKAERPLFTSSAALRRQAWARVGGFRDQPTGQDRDLFVRLALAEPVAVSDRATAVAVYRSGGISDRRASGPRARPPECLEDLAPSVRTLLNARPSAAETQRRSIDLYARCYLHWSVQEAARAGDVASLRALRTLYGRPVRWWDKLPLAVGMLPDTAARGALRLLFPRAGGG